MSTEDYINYSSETFSPRPQQKGEKMPKLEKPPEINSNLVEWLESRRVKLDEQQMFAVTSFIVMNYLPFGPPAASEERTALQNTLTELERGNVFKASQILRAALQSVPSSLQPGDDPYTKGYRRMGSRKFANARRTNGPRPTEKD